MIVLLIIGAGIIGVLSVVVVVLFVSIVINVATQVPFAGTPQGRIEWLFDYLKLQPGTRLYDLGCGDGRVVFAAARRGAFATGYEIQPLTYLRAKIVQFTHYPAAKIRFGNFHNANLANAQIVFCFLVDAVMPSVAAQLEEKLAPGCTVVSYGFPLPGWQANMVLEPLPPNGSKIFLYKKNWNTIAE